MIRLLVNGTLLLASVAILAATGLWLWLEREWSAWTPPEGSVAEVGYAAFASGAFGLEAMPLKYAAVVGKVSPSAFVTGVEDGRSLWRTYGFLDNPEAENDDAPVCAANAAQKLPYGFAVTNFLPATGYQSPIQFAALTCASCHSGQLLGAEGSRSAIIPGMGNPELDVIAFSDAVRSAVTDPELTVDKILAAYESQCGADDAGFIERQFEKAILNAWLSGIRATVGGDFAKYGMPYRHDQIKDARYIEAGPGRTRPFRSVVRVALDLPGVANYAYSKIPVVFEQRADMRPRSQYDGSIKSPVTRSYIAAFASGATTTALAKPPVAHAIRSAAAYTEALGIDIPVAAFDEVFPEAAPEAAEVARGFEVYMAHCADCHGYRPPDGGPWRAEGKWLHQFEYIDGRNRPQPIGVDAARVSFRYAHKLPLALWTALPGPGGVADRQAAALDAEIKKASAAGEPAFAYFWQELSAKFAADRKRFPGGHPLYFPECAYDDDDEDCDLEDMVRFAPFCSDGVAAEDCALSSEVAFFNNPIPRAYLRAPYLHNASVPTMRQLLHLDRRPARFCRGENVYDPDALGFITPPPGPNGSCDAPRMSFLFDTKQPGNSNAGHDFPWKPEEIDAGRRQDLEALLAYLKTL